MVEGCSRQTRLVSWFWTHEAVSAHSCAALIIVRTCEFLTWKVAASAGHGLFCSIVDVDNRLQPLLESRVLQCDGTGILAQLATYGTDARRSDHNPSQPSAAPRLPGRRTRCRRRPATKQRRTAVPLCPAAGRWGGGEGAIKQNSSPQAARLCVLWGAPLAASTYICSDKFRPVLELCRSRLEGTAVHAAPGQPRTSNRSEQAMEYRSSEQCHQRRPSAHVRPSGGDTEKRPWLRVRSGVVMQRPGKPLRQGEERR